MYVVLSDAVPTQQEQVVAQHPRVAGANVRESDEDDDVVQQQVLDCLITDFLHLVDSADLETARHYIISNQMNLEAALTAFFDDQITSLHVDDHTDGSGKGLGVSL